MLVLSRNPDEAIWIDERIKVMVVGVKGQRVRLGIEAPVDVPIRREELPPAGPGQSDGHSGESQNAEDRAGGPGSGPVDR